MMESYEFEKYLPICTLEYIDLRYKYFSKSRDKVVMMGKSAPAVSSSEVYLLSNFLDQLKPLQNEDTFNIAF